MTNGEIVNDTVAAAAIVNPIWLPWVHGPSPTLAWVLQIMGIVWLSIQMGRFFIGLSPGNRWLALSIVSMIALAIFLCSITFRVA